LKIDSDGFAAGTARMNTPAGRPERRERNSRISILRHGLIAACFLFQIGLTGA
jgi:hypothetical protein